MASICRERGLLVLVRNGIWSRLISTQQLVHFSLVVAKPILSSTFKDLEVLVLPKPSPLLPPISFRRKPAHQARENMSLGFSQKIYSWIS